MEVVQELSALVSNYEVLEAFREDKEKRNGLPVRHGEQRRSSVSMPEGDQDKRTLEYEVLHYLEKTVCQSQSSEQIVQFLKESKHWGLTKAEKLMIINHVPKNAVELYVLIEEPTARFGPEDDALMTKLDEMVACIKKSFS